MRKALLFELKSLDALVALLAPCPVFKGHPPDSVTTLRIAELAGVPHLDSNGFICRPSSWAMTLAKRVPPKGSQAAILSCSFCNFSASTLWSCSACLRSYCGPVEQGCGVLSPAHARAVDSSADHWWCPDCCQFAAVRLAGGQAGGDAAKQSLAKASMDTLAAAPSAYPSTSAPLLVPPASVL